MVAVNTHLCFSLSNPKIITTERQCAGVFVPCQALQGKCYYLKTGYSGHQFTKSASKAIQAVLSGTGEVTVPSSSIEEFTITASSPDKEGKLKITVEVSGTKTQELYDKVFSKMVGDAQPIPGFRRGKGGKTLDIPKHILLEILGPSNVKEQVIRKVINSATAQYVSKAGLNVAKDLQIKQSLEDLEAGFEPGDRFRFDATVQFHDLK